MDKEKARRIVEELLLDIFDRSGIGDEYYQIDDETKEELKETWTEIVLNVANED